MLFFDAAENEKHFTTDKPRPSELQTLRLQICFENAALP